MLTTKKHNKQIPPAVQVALFQEMIENAVKIPSVRWAMMKYIESQEAVDNASLRLQLKQLEIEIIKKGGDGDVV